MFNSVLLYLISFTGGAISTSLFTPCRISDLACIEMTVNTALPQIFDGIPELGIKSTDPQTIEIIEFNLPTFNMTLWNTTITGYKKCRLSNFKLNEDSTRIYCDGNCGGFRLSGQYETNGLLISVPIEGKGDFIINTEEYFVQIETRMKKVKGDDEKTHFVIKDFKINSIPMGVVTYKFENLFNGQEDLVLLLNKNTPKTRHHFVMRDQGITEADVVHKFIKENWREVTALLEYPVWYASLGTVSNNVNQYLQNFAVEDSLF